MAKCPKIIHQIWLDFGKGAKIPDKYKQNTQRTVQLHPNWKYMLWEDDNSNVFVRDHFSSDMYHMFRSLKRPISKTDVLRLLVLFIYGGVYLDMDIIVLKPLDELTRYESVVPSCNMFNTCTNCMLASAPASEFITRCVDNVVDSACKWNFNHSAIAVLMLAGPLFITRRANECKDVYRFRDYTDAESFCGGMFSHSSNKAFFRHECCGSWLGFSAVIIEALVVASAVLVMTITLFLMYRHYSDSNQRLSMVQLSVCSSSPCNPHKL